MYYILTSFIFSTIHTSHNSRHLIKKHKKSYEEKSTKHITSTNITCSHTWTRHRLERKDPYN